MTLSWLKPKRFLFHGESYDFTLHKRTLYVLQRLKKRSFNKKTRSLIPSCTTFWVSPQSSGSGIVRVTYLAFYVRITANSSILTKKLDKCPPFLSFSRQVLTEACHLSSRGSSHRAFILPSVSCKPTNSYYKFAKFKNYDQ